MLCGCQELHDKTCSPSPSVMELAFRLTPGEMPQLGFLLYFFPSSWFSHLFFKNLLTKKDVHWGPVRPIIKEDSFLLSLGTFLTEFRSSFSLPGSSYCSPPLQFSPPNSFPRKIFQRLFFMGGCISGNEQSIPKGLRWCRDGSLPSAYEMMKNEK